uniref:Protein kinase domain-containing protein n=1 Tax=Bionectria ochroleuca TaxID=29856 RepID=A0A8H7THP7_BIOOC
MSPKEAGTGTKRLYHPDRVRHIRDNGEYFCYEDNTPSRRHIMEPNGTATAAKIRPAKKTRQELEKAQVLYQFDPDKKFIPRRQYANIMTPERVLEIIYDLPCFHSQTPEWKQTLAQNICFGSDGQRPALKIFGALIMSNLELEHDISEHLNSGLNDSCLPLKADTGDGADKLYCACKKENHIKTMNSDEYSLSEREGFLRWVRRLTAPYVAYQPKRHSHYVLDPGNCIPISDTTTRIISPEHKNSRTKKNPDNQGGNPVNGGYGGFSEVHRVQLHDCHCRLPDTGLRHSQGFYALKKLTSHNRLDFELELASLLFSADQNVDKRHMIQVLATFEERLISQSTFYFLFDCAEGPLEYFWRQHESLVGNMSHCLSMSEQFLGLGQTLEAIHNDRLSFPLPDDLPELRNIPNFKNMYGRHGDIKPSNILYFQPLKGEGRLVLADFGLGSRLHTKVSRSNQDPKLLNRTETYRSPEFDLPDGLVGPRADVYSLGCVFLEHIGWFLLGADFPDKFSDDRLMKDMYGFEVDTFFMLTDRKVAVIKPAVKKWIADLKENKACSWFLVQMLELIEDQMLACDKESRIRASPLVKKLKALQEACQISKTFYMKTWKDCECPVIPESGR